MKDLKACLKEQTEKVDLRKKAAVNVDGAVFDLGIVTRLIRALPKDFEVVHENHALYFTWNEGRGMATIYNSEKAAALQAEYDKKNKVFLK